MGIQVPDVSDFFQVNDDVSKITWAHAINSRRTLKKSVNDPEIMMFESDVSTGNIIGDHNGSEQIPIMAHPPHRSSDLSLEEFLNEIISVNKEGFKKGIKLDFKDIDAVRLGFKVLKQKEPQVAFPLWLNADILCGPKGENKTPIDADEFLSLSSELFPHATLSLGWTCEYDPDPSLCYSLEMVEEMMEAIERNDINQPVTFPICASYVCRSLNHLMFLIDSVLDSSLTIWTFPGETVDCLSLVGLQDMAGEDRVYFDLPKGDKEEFNLLRGMDSCSSPSVGIFPKQTSLYLSIAAFLGCLGALLFSLKGH